MNRYRKHFFTAMFIRQNKYHRFGVVLHTLAVVSQLVLSKNFRMVPAGILHDIGKMAAAHQDQEDIKEGLGNLSFHNHEEIGYQIIKDWYFISKYTKNLVRNHYIIRARKKAKDKNNIGKYNRLTRIWNNLSKEERKDISIFMKYDDLGKKSFYKC